MKRSILYALSLSLLLAGCGGAKSPVTVTNPSDFGRREVVRIDLSKVAANQPGITPENAVVCDTKGKDLECDVRRGVDSVPYLFFIADVPASGTSRYVLEKGKRKAMQPLVMSRPVPERYDDAAFENFQVAFRTYGRGLEWQTISPGIDVWVKYGGKLVMDGWYSREVKQKDSYHVDHGEGEDCYKVGKTLGCGGSSPMVDDTLAKPDHNFASYVKLVDGTLEQSFSLKYTPWSVGKNHVSLTKTITITATGNFCKAEDVYEGDFDTLYIAVGVAKHDVVDIRSGHDYVTVWDKPSETKAQINDGFVAAAAYVPGCDTVMTGTVPNNAILLKKIVPGQKLTYYFGSGWSKGNIKDPETWAETVRKLRESVEHPLIVEY